MAAYHPTRAHTHRGRLATVLAVSSGIFLLELVGGLMTNSLALLADAGHVFTDVAAMGLALFAIWLGDRPPTPRRTFGLSRAEIVAAVVNALVLLALAGAIIVEAWRRLGAEPHIASGPMLAIAAVGAAANLGSAWVLRDAQSESLNMRAVFLDLLMDTLGSAAVMGAALVIALTGFGAVDAIASALIGLLILPRTWRLLREALDVLLEATPRDVDMDEVRRHILEAPGVRDVHDLHAWTITSGLNVVSAHVVIDESARPPDVLDSLCRCLSTQFDIEHSTFQLEQRDRTPVELQAHR